MVTLLGSVLYKGNSTIMSMQIITVENSFTLKMETLLTQRFLLMVNTQTAHMDLLYDCL